MYYLCFLVVSCGTIMALSYLAYKYDGGANVACAGTVKSLTGNFVCAGISCSGMAVILRYASGNVTDGRDEKELLVYAAAAGLFAGSMYFACMTDMRVCEVYDLCWYLAVLAAVGLWKRKPLEIWGLSGLIIYFLIQQIIFVKFYGKADCHAFCICALFGSGIGMETEDFLRHMILSYGILIVHQLLRKNIGEKGRLKKPVPFLPYITGAFFLNILQLPGQF